MAILDLPDMLAAVIKPVAETLPAQPILKSSFVWKQIAEPVEPFLLAVAECLEGQVGEFEPEIAEFARYAIAARGKQLRPILVSLSGSATGAVSEQHVRVAAIIEMVHLATLVHDDIMDGAELRRGRPTLSAHWGNEISVLLGDCLFAHAVKMAAVFTTPEICRAVATSTNTVCSGEILQTQQRHNFRLPRPEYFRILSMKTAELFALACDLGAFLTNTTPECRDALRHYGMSLGTAYQIYDDCLDLFGLESAAGKSLGTDLAKGKLTLPIFHIFDRATATERGHLQDLIKNWQPGHLPEILEMAERYQSLAESRRVIHQYLGAARLTLQGIPTGDGRNGLASLADYLSEQTDQLDEA